MPQSSLRVDVYCAHCGACPRCENDGGSRRITGRMDDNAARQARTGEACRDLHSPPPSGCPRRIRFPSIEAAQSSSVARIAQETSSPPRVRTAARNVLGWNLLGAQTPQGSAHGLRLQSKRFADDDEGKHRASLATRNPALRFRARSRLRAQIAADRVFQDRQHERLGPGIRGRTRLPASDADQRCKIVSSHASEVLRIEIGETHQRSIRRGGPDTRRDLRILFNSRCCFASGFSGVARRKRCKAE